jgi:hypothetical protein
VPIGEKGIMTMNGMCFVNKNMEKLMDNIEHGIMGANRNEPKAIA